MPNPIYILDASGYLYRSFFALPAMTSPEGIPTNALYGFARALHQIITRYNPSSLVAVFDGPDNQKSRRELYADYKSHRKETPAELRCQIPLAFELCNAAQIPVLQLEGVEADDAIGSIATWTSSLEWETLICSSDKDLCQLINPYVTVLQPHKDDFRIDNEKVREIYGIEANQIADYLAIIGDRSDNIPGIPGLGPKKAVALLSQYGSIANIYSVLDAQSDALGASLSKTLLENREIALLSQKLAQIDLTLPIPDEASFYSHTPQLTPELIQLYRKYGFNSLLKEKTKSTSATATSPMEESASTEVFSNPLEVVTIISEEESSQFQTALEAFKKADKIAIAVGSASTHPKKCTGTPVAFYPIVETSSVIFLFLAPSWAQLLPLIREKLLVMHDSKLLFHAFSNAGFGSLLEQLNIFDLSITSYLLQAHSHDHALETLVSQNFQKSLVQPITLADAAYAMGTLHPLLWNKLHAESFYDTLWTSLERPLLTILVEMEQIGIYCDLQILKGIATYLCGALDELSKKIQALAGEEFNLNSPKQLSEILYDKLGIPPPKKKKSSKNPSTAADILEEIAYLHPIIPLILEYRSLEKLRSTYVESLPQQVYLETGRIHPSFNQTVASTGRLSCQNPNLQNIPIRHPLGKAIRSAFRPSQANYSFLSADYSQIELRLLAHLSQDPLLIEAFKNHKDIHTATAGLIFDIHPDLVSEEQRRQAKTVNFAVLYGQQGFSLAKELGITVARANQFIEAYFSRYEGVKRFIDQQIEKSSSSLRTETILGRRRFLADINHSNSMIRQATQRLAVNTPVQGSSADLIKLAMIQVSQELKTRDLPIKLLLQIHDELLLEGPTEVINAFAPRLKEIMESVWVLHVPLVVNLSIGEDWGKVS